MENEAKEAKSDALFHAVFIGFMIGIVLYSVAKGSVGLVTLIPLYIIYRLFKKSRNADDLSEGDLHTERSGTNDGADPGRLVP